MWLTDVAGAGKSAIAHTIAMRCHDEGILASCFFFDREVAGRNGSQKLFSTIARDLAVLSADIAERIGFAVERDQSLATASPIRQFQELVLGVCQWCPGGRPIVIIIDALDEGCDADTLNILRNEISKLPRNFRVFVTSRAEKAIVLAMSNRVHIHSRTIDIHGQANVDDISIYA